MPLCLGVNWVQTIRRSLKFSHWGGRKLSFGNKDELWQIIDLLSYVQIQPNCVLM